MRNEAKHSVNDVLSSEAQMEFAGTDELLDKYLLITEMLHKPQLRSVLEALESTIRNDVEGDIVELGCNEGTTSLFIQRLLNHYGSNKKFHVYDSFEGLPEVSGYDISETERQFTAGGCKTEKTKFYTNFDEANLSYPIVNQGWFSEIPDEKYPDKISFAFFDGDFYSSIMDSFYKVYGKLSKRARVCIHDYGWNVLPGVKKACEEFLSDKEEKVFVSGPSIGQLIKL